MTTLPYEPNDLLEATRLLDHLVWSYRRTIDRTPRAFLTAEHICLADYAARTAGLIRAIMEEDNRRRGVSFHHRPRPVSTQRSAHAEPARANRTADEPPAPAASFDALGPPQLPFVEPDPLAECEAAFAEEARSAFEDDISELRERASTPRKKVRP